MTDSADPHPATEGPAGIGGWLLLVAVGLVLTPLVLLLRVVLTAQVVGRLDERFATLITWIRIEMLANTLLLLYALYLLYPFFRKLPSFPTLFIGFLALSLLVVMADAAAAVVIFELPLDRGTIRDMARALIAALVWVPYMLVSRRVRNTFVAA